MATFDPPRSSTRADTPPAWPAEALVDAERSSVPAAPPHPPLPHEVFAKVVKSLASVIFTNRASLTAVVACIAAGGHLLVEDLPGLGKTTLAKALARSLGLGFRRVQFTADLLPADITGAMVIDPVSREVSFRHGPVFTNVLMADELNRASPRTQSSLLEAMEENQVTVDGNTYPLPRPFLVVATQNPHDAAGTSPLPHGQRDRFLMCLSLGYPSRENEDALLAGQDPAERVGALAAAISHEDLATLFSAVSAVQVSPALRRYVLDLVEATRTHPALRIGASPRAAMALLRAGKAMAVAEARTFCIPEDIQRIAVPVLGHRVVGTGSGATLSGNSVIDQIKHGIPVPTASTLLHPHP